MAERDPIQLILSVDVEDYYMSPESIPVVSWRQYEDRVAIGTERILDLLDKYNAVATFFVLGWVGRHHPDLVREISRRGHEIGTHTNDHRAVHEIESDDYRNSLVDSLATLRALAERPVIGHRAPVWSIQRNMFWAFELMARNGIQYDSSIYPVKTYLYGDVQAKRFPYRVGKDLLWEIPPSTVQWRGHKLPVGGGAYMRLFPLSYIKWACRCVNQEGHPAVLYVHPWELDPEHPIPTLLRGRERWVHSFGLRSTPRKLEALLATSRTRTMADYMDELNQQKSRQAPGETVDEENPDIPVC